MAETTLPAPRPQAPVRRRAFFGLFDADGWALGLGQGDLLVRRDDHAARLPAGPRVLLHRPEDRGPRPPAVVADQLLPARERDPAVSRAGRRDAPVAARRPPRSSCPAAAPTAPRGVVGQVYLYAGGSDGTAPKADVYFTRAVGIGNLDKWTGGPAAARGPGIGRERRHRQHDVRHRRLRARRQAHRHGLQHDPGQRRHVRRVDDRRRALSCPWRWPACRRPPCRTAS